MKQDNNEAPAIILDWLQQKDFAALNDAEKKLVLDFFSIEDYNEMREACKITSGYHQQKKEKELSRRKEIMKHYDLRHQKAPVIKLFDYRLPVWQIAAGLLPLILTWVFLS